MDAAQKTHHNSRLFLLIALALVLAAPGWSQTPAFTLSPSTVNLNQSVTGTTVSVGSTADPITFSPSISYAADGGNGVWLSVVPNSAQTTPASLGVQINNIAGLPVGNFSAT